MSGVVDENGQQWEHCHTCSDWVAFPQNLGYTAKFEAHLCLKCANKLPQEQLEMVELAPTWRLVCRPTSKFILKKENNGSAGRRLV